MLLAGCGSNTTTGTGTTTPPPTGGTSGAAFSGTVKAGSQPLVGASVQLYAAGTSGSGSTATALLSGALTTDSSGAFSVPAGYACPSDLSQLYVVARGGGIGSGAANSSIALLTTLGSCSQVAVSEHIIVNEVTTVANVWALAQFLSTGGNIGASSTNAVGLTNALATAGSLANPQTGTAPGATFPANGVAPTTRINSLANLLNSCTASASGSRACSSLLGESQDTLDAALRIVRSPGANVLALYTQSASSSAFSPALTVAPNDWTLFTTFTGGGLFEPTGLGIDSKGNVWVASYSTATDYNAGLVTEFSPLGQALFPSGITGSGLNSTYGLAVDAQDNVWIANQQSDGSVNNSHGSVVELNSSGQVLSGATGYSSGGLAYPTAIGISQDGSVWVVDYWEGNVVKLSSVGKPLSGSDGYTSDLLAPYPVAIAIDSSGNAWIGNSEGTLINRVASDGSSITPFNCCEEASGLAFDQAGNLWATNFLGESVTELSSTGVDLSNGGYPANDALLRPQGIAVDGSGNVWVSNYYAGFLAELAGASSSTPGQSLSPAAGWSPEAQLWGAYANAIDASGNLWVSNRYGASITEFVGIATPVKTPLIGPPQAP